jgi:hypothetical protein
VRVFAGELHVMSGNAGTVCARSTASPPAWRVVFAPAFPHVAIWPDLGSISFLSFDMASSSCAYMLYNAGPVVKTTVAYVCGGNVAVDYFPEGIVAAEAWTSGAVVHAGGDVVVANGEAHVFLGEGHWGATAAETQDVRNARSKHLRLNAGAPGHAVCGSGFRHPWTATYDAADDAFYVGDVGLSSYEEMTRIPRAGACPSAGEAPNFYGWPVYEGFARGQLEARQAAGSALRPPAFVMQHACAPGDNFDALVGADVGVIVAVLGVALAVAFCTKAFRSRDAAYAAAFALACAGFVCAAALLVAPWARAEHEGYATWTALFVTGHGASPAGKARAQYGNRQLWENTNKSAHAVPACVGISMAAAVLGLGWLDANAAAAAADVVLLAVVCTRVAMYDGYEVGAAFVTFASLALVFHVTAFCLYRATRPRSPYTKIR